MKRLTLFTLVLCLLLPGCNRRFKLQDGFRAVSIHGDTRILAKPDNRIVIRQSVIAVADNEKFIIGLREEADPKPRFPDWVEDQPYGYFIYDKTTEELTLGLSKAELLDLSEEKGIELELDF